MDQITTQLCYKHSTCFCMVCTVSLDLVHTMRYGSKELAVVTRSLERLQITPHKSNGSGQLTAETLHLWLARNWIVADVLEDLGLGKKLVSGRVKLVWFLRGWPRPD